MKLRVRVDLGMLKGHKEIEVEINHEDFKTADGKIDRTALDETAQDILFQKLISWDWSISGEGSENE